MDIDTNAVCKNAKKCVVFLCSSSRSYVACFLSHHSSHIPQTLIKKVPISEKKKKKKEKKRYLAKSEKVKIKSPFIVSKKKPSDFSTTW